MPENTLDSDDFFSYNVSKVECNSTKAAAYKNSFDVAFLAGSLLCAPGVYVANAALFV